MKGQLGELFKDRCAWIKQHGLLSVYSAIDLPSGFCWRRLATHRHMSIYRFITWYLTYILCIPSNWAVNVYFCVLCVVCTVGHTTHSDTKLSLVTHMVALDFAPLNKSSILDKCFVESCNIQFVRHYLSYYMNLFGTAKNNMGRNCEVHLCKEKL